MVLGEFSFTGTDIMAFQMVTVQLHDLYYAIHAN